VTRVPVVSRPREMSHTPRRSTPKAGSLSGDSGDDGPAPFASEPSSYRFSLDLSDTPFSGRTSRPGQDAAILSNCRRCGSSLVKRRVDTITVGEETVDVYRCRCGAGRRVKYKAVKAVVSV
jgi:hypothetical protein